MSIVSFLPSASNSLIRFRKVSVHSPLMKKKRREKEDLKDYRSNYIAGLMFFLYSTESDFSFWLSLLILSVLYNFKNDLK